MANMIGAKNAYPAPCWNKSEKEKPGFREAIINAKTPKATNIPQRSVGGPHWAKNVFLSFLEAVIDFPSFVIHHPLRNIPSPTGVYNWKKRILAFYGANGKKQRKRPCEAVLWKKLYRIFGESRNFRISLWNKLLKIASLLLRKTQNVQPKNKRKLTRAAKIFHSWLAN